MTAPMPDIPAEAAIRADERARIAADLEARAKAIEDSRGENHDWLAEQFATHLPSLPIGGAVQDDPRTIAVEAYRGVAFIVSAPPDACPSAAPESTQSPETTAVAPVYPPDLTEPSEALSAPRGEDAHPLASSHASEHADLRRRYAEAMAESGFRTFWPGLADAVLAVRDDELVAALESIDDLNDLIRQERVIHIETIRRAEQAETAIARVRALHQPTDGMGFNCDEDPTPGSYGRIAQVCTSCGTPGEQGVRWPCATARALDGADAVPEHTGPQAKVCSDACKRTCPMVACEGKHRAPEEQTGGGNG